MKNEKKLSLEEIKVESFITTLTIDEKEAVKGGLDEALGTTAVRIFC